MIKNLTAVVAIL